MIDQLLLPFSADFMQNAFMVAVMLAVPTALLSCFVVLSGWSLMGDAISHAILPGVVLAYIFGFPLVVGAFGAGMLTAIGSGYIADHSRVKRDTVMGVVFSGMFALGIVLYTAITSDIHLDHILFGNILGISADDLWTVFWIAAPVTLVMMAKWKDFMLHAFDPVQALASGLPVKVLHYGFLIMLTLTVVATMRSTGLILAVGLLIAPGSIAFLLTRSLGRMLVIAVVVCLVAMVGGVYASFFLDSASGPTVMLILSALFIVTLVAKLTGLTDALGARSAR